MIMEEKETDCLYKVPDGVYKVPAIQTPSLTELGAIAEELGLYFKDVELGDLQGYMSRTLIRRYQIVNDIEAHTLPVKYPRTAGYRPEPEDNLCNAWYWKCNIEGAPKGILKGKTVGVKDNICVAGIPMMNGSKVMEGFTPDIDATVITKVFDAGGRIVGKNNCEHLCYGGSSWANDTGPTLNPHDETRVCGGSSSGCAAAICNGEIDMAIGADQGGSIRAPASWCGIVGLKPTWGLVPYTGAVPMEITMDHLGPMAANVYDCALLLELNGKLDGWNIGLLSEGFRDCNIDVQSMVRTAAQQLGEVGAQVEDMSVPLHTHGEAIWQPIMTEGAYQCMFKGAGAGYHYKGYYPESMMIKMASGYKMKARHISEPVKSALVFGKYVEKSAWKTILECLKNTAPFDSTGHPALTVNAGKSDGLPVGIMIVGKRFEDTKVLQVAFAIEQLQNGGP